MRAPVTNSLFLLFSNIMIACVHLDVDLTGVVLAFVPTKQQYFLSFLHTSSEYVGGYF